MSSITLVYGGSFDPPHAVHARLASQAADAVHARRILVIPAGVNPQRRDAPPAAPEHRLAMATLDRLKTAVDLNRHPRPCLTSAWVFALHSAVRVREVPARRLRCLC